MLVSRVLTSTFVALSLGACGSGQELEQPAPAPEWPMGDASTEDLEALRGTRVRQDKAASDAPAEAEPDPAADTDAAGAEPAEPSTDGPGPEAAVAPSEPTPPN